MDYINYLLSFFCNKPVTNESRLILQHPRPKRPLLIDPKLIDPYRNISIIDWFYLDQTVTHCPLCSGEFLLTRGDLSELRNCRHIFHEECLQSYFLEGHLQCPCCCTDTRMVILH